MSGYSIDELDLQKSFGDFNIIKLVTEHAPLRIEEIDEELNAMSLRGKALSIERRTLAAMVDAAVSSGSTATFQPETQL